MLFNQILISGENSNFEKLFSPSDNPCSNFKSQLRSKNNDSKLIQYDRGQSLPLELKSLLIFLRISRERSVKI